MVKTYDPKKIVLTVGAFPIGGFADGTFIKVSRSEDTFSKKVGADGDTTRVKSSDKSGSIEITLSSSSLSNDILSQLAVRDELSGTGVVPVAVKDLNGASTYVGASAWVKKMPDAEYGKDLTDNVWVLDCANLRMFTGGYIL